MSNLIGQILIRQYRVESFVAAGGMGTVYRVWDLKRQTPLAMKVMHDDFADNPSTLKLFKREANALKKLIHPHIVPFYGFYQDGDLIFLLSQFIDGTTLKRVIRQQDGPIPLDQALIYLQTVGSALGYAHTFGVVHCDVKPGNVMIDQGGSIYLTDFGIARHADSTITTIGVAGTLPYMAPEQCRMEPVTPQTDIYALGIMFYEMAAGRRPFLGDEESSEQQGTTAKDRIHYAQIHLDPPDPQQFNPDLPEPLVDVLFKALSKLPQDRFTTTQEFVESAASAANTTAGEIGKRVRLDPALVPAPGIEEHAPTQPSNRGILIGGIAAILVLLVVIAGLIFFRKPPDTESTAVVFEDSSTEEVEMPDTLPPTAELEMTATPIQADEEVEPVEAASNTDEPETTEEPDQEETPQPNAIVKSGPKNATIQSEPSWDTNPFDVLDDGTPLEITFITEDGEWVRVIMPSGLEGWMHVDVLEIFIDLDDVPVRETSDEDDEADIPSTTQPTPTATSASSRPTTCEPIINTWAAEQAPADSAHVWQLVYDVTGATTLDLFGHQLIPPSGIFPLYGQDNGTFWVLRAYNGPECWIEESLYVASVDSLPAAGTFSFGGSTFFTDVDVSQRDITISLKDVGQVDGDIVQVILNGQIVLNSYTLTGSWTPFSITLTTGSNSLEIKALNQGSVGPNTVGVRISHVISGLPDQISRDLQTGQSDNMTIRAP